MRARPLRLKAIPSDFVKKLLKCNSSRPSLGTDPEFFVTDKKGKVLASDKFFPGKKEPWHFDINNEYQALFFDGIQAEMNIIPSKCRETVSYFVRQALIKAKEKIGSDHDILLKPSVRVQKSVINGADPQAKIFGCEPDFNAYTLGQNTCEMDASKHPYRYAGGHIHIGMGSKYAKAGNPEYEIAKTEEGHIRAIKFIDYITGAILVMMDKGVDAKRRRTKYGTAGCFRPTPYGLEYRTPSCWWMKSPATFSLTFGLIRLAWNMLISKYDEELVRNVGYSVEDVRGIVDENDTVAAKRFWKQIRPYIAVTTYEQHNPLHIKSIRTRSNGFIEDKPQWLKSISESKMPPIKGGSSPVYSLAAFEYMVKHGSKSFITDNVQEEWSFSSVPKFYNINGFIDGMYSKLCFNADFKKFQKDFITHIL